jgi:hypothetical protein
MMATVKWIKTDSEEYSKQHQALSPSKSVAGDMYLSSYKKGWRGRAKGIQDHLMGSLAWRADVGYTQPGINKTRVRR